MRDSIQRGDPDSEYEDYHSLVQRLGELEKESIGKGLRTLVREALGSDPEVDDPDAVAREVSKIYGWRSKLIHAGWVEEDKVKTGIDRLTDIVPRVLTVLLLSAANSESR